MAQDCVVTSLGSHQLCFKASEVARISYNEGIFRLVEGKKL